MSENKQIISKSDLLQGELFDKPRRAKVTYGADGEPIYICPNCGATATSNECDCIGAEPDCLFCNQCNLEFECGW